MFRRCLLFTVASVLLPASISFAASTLTFSATGDSAYQLQGVDLSGVAGFDITLSYDPSVLSAPQVAQSPLLSGALLQVNPNTPGIVRISAVTLKPMKGSGQILTVSFTRRSIGSGIRDLSARLIDVNGKTLPSQVQLAVAPDSRGTSDLPGSGASRETIAGSGMPAAGAALPGTVAETNQPAPPEEPGNQGGITEAELDSPDPDQPEPPVSPANASDKQQRTSKTLYTQPSILECFRDFKGERTIKSYLGIFDQEPLIGFRQEPAVALADGSAKVTVRFISTPERERTADLALMGARLLASQRDPDATNTWIVTLLPEKGTERVSLSVPQKDMLMVYPLTVAPRADIDLDKSGVVNEADFSLFLKERGSVKAPVYDLNRDGARDYRDDYIFTSNYLASRKK